MSDHVLTNFRSYSCASYLLFVRGSSFSLEEVQHYNNRYKVPDYQGYRDRGQRALTQRLVQHLGHRRGGLEWGAGTWRVTVNISKAGYYVNIWSTQ